MKRLSLFIFPNRPLKGAKQDQMFDNLAKKVAEKMGRSVKETVQPIVKETSRKVDSKVDLYSRVLRLGVLIFLFIEGTKKVSNAYSESESHPNQIIINNYIDRGDRREKEERSKNGLQ